jgi:WD40 repeat protein/serine/threonine protein kinase
VGVYRAVKIVFRNSFESDRPFQREWSGIRKFEPISRLHEGFVDVLQVGINEEQGYFYYIMELGDDQVSGQQIDPARYVPNTLLSEIERRGRLSLQECLQLGLALSHALAELHKHGLVHRDIKPSNIIFVDGTPKLADIGLVAGLDETRSYVGTEGFIAPEGPGEPQADIYSFGKVLYEASTGKDRHDFPEWPPEWSQSPEYEGLLELNEVFIHACQPKLAERYRSAWDLHADLVVIVNGKSVKRLRLLERRMARLKRTVGVGAIGMAIASIVGIQIYREWRAAIQEHQREITANLNYGNRALDSGDILSCLPYFIEVLRLHKGEPQAQKTDRLRLGSVLAECPKLTRMWQLPKEPYEAHFSPDGKCVLLAEYYGPASICEVATGKQVSNTFHPDRGLRGAAYSQDGRFITTVSECNTAYVFNATLVQVLALPHTNKVFSARFSPDGRRIITACKDGFARVWDAQTGESQLTLAHGDVVAFAAFSHDGRLLVTTSYDGTARIWRTNDAIRPAWTLNHGPNNWVNWADFSPDDQMLVTACSDHKARLWDVATGKQVRPDLLHSYPVKSAEFSPDGRLILTASFDGTARLWRTSDLHPAGASAILRQAEPLTCASFSPDARRIITTCVDGSVRIWDLAGARMPPPGVHRRFTRDGSRFLILTNGRFTLYETATGHPLFGTVQPQLPLEQVQFGADGLWVFALSEVQTNGPQTSRMAYVWNAVTAQLVNPGVRVPASLDRGAISASGRYLALYGGTNVQILNLRDGGSVTLALVGDALTTSALFSPAADLLVTLNGARVLVWKSETGRLAFPPLAHQVPAVYAEFSRDGRFLVTCSSDPQFTKCAAYVWDSSSGQPVNGGLKHSDGVLSASFAPGGDRLVTTSEDFTAKLWQRNTGRQIGFPLQHADHVYAAAFNSDGRWVATASGDHTARIWDAENGEPITPPLPHFAALVGVQFLPGARHLVTSDGEGNTFCWELTPAERSPDELSRLAQLLTGSPFLSTGNATAAPQEPPAALWEQLSAKYEQDFLVSRDEILKWHEHQVDQCESDEQWSAAAFHLSRLIDLQPDNASLPARLEKVKTRLDSQTSVEER